MNKKVLIGIGITIAITALAYFGVLYFKTPTLAEGFGIGESDIQFVVDFSSGENGTIELAPLTIMCGKDYARNFTVTLQQANLAKLKPGYQALSVSGYEWFSIIPPSYQGGQFPWNKTTFNEALDWGDVIYVPAGCSRRLQIQLNVPDSEEFYGENWEVRAQVREAGSPDFVPIALEARWFIVISG